MNVYVSIIDEADGPADIVDIMRDIPGAIKKAKNGKHMMVFAEPDLYEMAKQQLVRALWKDPLPPDCAGSVNIVRALFISRTTDRHGYAIHPDDLPPSIKPKCLPIPAPAVYARLQAHRAGVPQSVTNALDRLTEAQRRAVFSCYVDFTEQHQPIYDAEEADARMRKTS